MSLNVNDLKDAFDLLKEQFGIVLCWEPSEEGEDYCEASIVTWEMALKPFFIKQLGLDDGA